MTKSTLEMPTELNLEQTFIPGAEEEQVLARPTLRETEDGTVLVWETADATSKPFEVTCKTQDSSKLHHLEKLINEAYSIASKQF